MSVRLSLTDFHAYDPRGPRRLLVGGGVACVGMAAWAVDNALRAVEPYAWARAAVAALLALGFALSFVRLRPRDGWGVLLTARGLVFSPPLAGTPVELRWRDVRSLEREGRGRGRLVLVLDGGRLVLPRHLFPSRGAFEALVREVEERLPAPPFDA